MKRYAFMNHRIRQAKPAGPVIVVQDADGNTIEANGFDLRFDGFRIGRIVFDPKGLPACKTHDVKAWVELTENVEVIPDAPPAEKPRPFAQKPLIPLAKQASAKKPNKPVDFT